MSQAVAPSNASPSMAELFRVFGKIGLINFGGPAGQIALMHRVLVDEKAWIGEDAFLRALNFCTLLPGPEAQQLATYVGWKLHGVRGGLLAGLLFVLPGAAVILALSILYAYAANLAPVAAAFFGIKAAVLAIVFEAMVKVARRALKTTLQRGLALASFFALFLFQAPFPLVILGAGVIGFLVARTRPDWLRLERVAPDPNPTPPPYAAALRTALTWAAIWAAPMLLIAATLGPRHILFQLGAFFAKLALVTFGGAYSVLSYMAQEAVSGRGWLKAGEMLDGLGLAETTPGPLIMVTEFVGFLAAFRVPAPFPALIAGVAGAAITLWMTFAPCFLWIFVGAPFVERLERAPAIQGALAAITAAVVGVIANLTLWFALRVYFTRFREMSLGRLTLNLPELSSLNPWAVVLSAVAAVLLLRLRLGVVKTLLAAILLGVALHALGQI